MGQYGTCVINAPWPWAVACKAEARSFRVGYKQLPIVCSCSPLTDFRSVAREQSIIYVT